MTTLLYQHDSYLHSFEATIVDIDSDNHAIILDKTAFFPGGGGQPPDQGEFFFGNVGYRINRVRKLNNQLLHMIDGEDPLPKVGSKVQCELDWQRRYTLMRTHTAMHILCGVIFRDYGAQVTGGDMELLRGRMDFEFETMHRELVDEIQMSINQEVQNSRQVKISILPRDEAFQIPDLIRTKINLLPEGITEVRVVEIVGLDLQADGGTHVKNTSEVGALRVVDYKSKGKINKRIYIEVLN